ncbi:MAG: hypothetical protein ACO3XO_07045, partial [Bdellovibrionota bacterium]
FNIPLPFSVDLEKGDNGHQLSFAGVDRTGSDYRCNPTSFDLSQSLGFERFGSLSCQFEEWNEDRSIRLKWDAAPLLGSRGICRLSACASESCEGSSFDANLIVAAPLKTLIPSDLERFIGSLLCEMPIGVDVRWESSNNEFALGLYLGGFTF